MPNQKLTLIILSVSVLAALLFVPALTLKVILHPAFLACIAAGIFYVLLLVLRFQFAAGGPDSRPNENKLLALFLFLMPTVYIASHLWYFLIEPGMHPLSTDWLLVEGMGQVIFGVLAVIGFRQSYMVLGLGIILHGLLWDSWHMQGFDYVPGWYAQACLVFDIGWGAYVLLWFRPSS